jgi:hypothetical protein
MIKMNISVLMLDLSDLKCTKQSQKQDIYLIFVHDEKISPKRKMIQTGNIQMENHEDGL